MKFSRNFLIIGEIFLDVHLNENVVRLGGICHAIRGCLACGVKPIVAYFTPDYLIEIVQQYLKKVGIEQTVFLGKIKGCPNIVLIEESQEIGYQNYRCLLRETCKVESKEEQLKEIIDQNNISDVLIFPGCYNLGGILRLLSKTKTAVHIDLHYNVSKDILSELTRPFETIFISTSSNIFLKDFSGDPAKLVSFLIPKLSKKVMLKENRGGVRLFQAADVSIVSSVPTYLRDIVHSVGVGDCFNSVYLNQRLSHTEEIAMRYASFISAEYASTWSEELFLKSSCETLKIPAEEIAALEGVRLPWEERPNFQIYLAAPDFSDLPAKQKEILEKIVNCLEYHNFKIRRPIKEHGEASAVSTKIEKQKLFEADLSLMSKCKLMLAVLLYNDQGTLVEIGRAAEKGMPVIIYDPFSIAKNLFLEKSATIVSSRLDRIVNAVFKIVSQLYTNNLYK